MPPGVQRAWLALASLLAPSDTMWKINGGFWWRTSAQKGSFQLCRCTVTGTNPGSACKHLCVHYHNINICNFFYWPCGVVQSCLLLMVLWFISPHLIYLKELNHSWGTFSICAGGKEAEEGIGKQFGIVRSGRYTKSSWTAVFGKLFWEQGLVSKKEKKQTSITTHSTFTCGNSLEKVNPGRLWSYAGHTVRFLVLCAALNYFA